MAVQAVQLSTTGLIPNTTGLGKNLSQQLPTPIYIETNDTLATVLGKTNNQPSYLNKSKNDFQFPYSNQQMALVYTTDQGTVWLSVVVSAISGGGFNYGLQGTTNVSTTYEASNGSAAAPSYTFVSDTTTGAYLASAGNLGLTAAGAEVANLSATGMSVTGALSATTTVTAGTNVVAGSSGHAGTVSSFPATASKGSLVLTAVANTGNTITTISNAAMGQASVISIPDPGAATANFAIAPAALVSGNFIKATGAGTIADSGIAAASSLEYATISLTQAQINALSATPILVIPSPGAGYMIVVQSAVLELVYGSAEFAGSHAAYLIYGTSGTNYAGSATMFPAAFMTNSNAANSVIQAAGTINGTTGLTTANAANEPIYITAAGSFTNGGTGSAGIVTVWYTIQPVT